MSAAPGTGSTSRSLIAHTRASTRSGENPAVFSIEVRSEPAHLIFEGRKRTDVKDAPRLLLVERGDRFGADDFAREACTAVNGTLASTMRKVASTISPPLFISATMRSPWC